MPVLRKRLVAGFLAAAMVFAAAVACSSDEPSPSEPETPQVGS